MITLIKRFWGLRLALGLALAGTAADAAITGTVTTIGGYRAGYRDGDNLVSQFRSPRGLAVGPSGLVYVADFGNNRIRTVNPSTQVTSTFASGMSGPVAVALDNLGRVYVVNNSSGTLDRLDASGTELTQLGAGLADPTAVVLDSLDGSGNIYVSQSDGHIFRFSTTSTGGTPNGELNIPGAGRISGLAMLVPGTLVASDSFNHVIWLVPISSATPTVLAGSLGVAGFADGSGATARFNTPQGIAVTSDGVIVVADQKNHRVRAVNNVGSVSTLYGVNPSTWTGQDPATLPGWSDGNAADAELRDPMGIAAGPNKAVFDSENYYHLIRMATGLTFPTNAPSGTVPPDTGTPTPPTSGNRMTLGFSSGEASSDFIGHPGQHFIAPVTLSVLSNTTIYGMQMNLNISNTIGTNNITNLPMTFHSHLTQPSGFAGFKIPIDPKTYIETSFSVRYLTNLLDTATGSVFVVTAIRESVGYFADVVFTNASGNMLGVGWLERYTQTNLYNTLQHDLITTSQAHDTEFLKANGKIVVGSYGFTVPNGALNNQYEIRIGRPSANGDGVASDVPIAVPNDPSSGLSAVRRLAIASRPYLVGDVAPFRWFNAGDFGDTNILNNDLEQIHQSASYRFNTPPPESDMFDALDSCCLGADGTDYSDPNIFDELGIHVLGNNEINAIAYGDHVLNLADIFVTFRRSLDPDLLNYVRYWTNRVEGGVTVARRWSDATQNLFRGTVGDAATTVTKKKKDSDYNVARSGERITAKVSVASQFGLPGSTVKLPVNLTVTGPLAVRSLRLQVKVSGLDSASGPAAFTPTIGLPWSGGGFVGNTLDVTWFEMDSGFGTGTHTIGTINVHIPADANADTLYTLEVAHAEVANGITMFPTTTESGIVITPDRATQPWNDDIPDDWRIQYFGSLMNMMSAPDADSDGDGFTTLQEFRAGTNPTDPTSLLAVTVKRGISAVVLTWSSIIGKSYKLESSPSLSNPTWTVVEQGITGSGGTVQRARPLDSLERFFRVSAQ